MAFFFAYLVFLFIAPQLWIEPFIGLRTDVALFPLWLIWAMATGRGGKLVRFNAQDYFYLGMIAWMTISAVIAGFGDKAQEIIFNYAKWFVLYRLIIVTLPTLQHVRMALMLLLGFALLLSVEGIQHMHSEDGLGWAGQSFAWMDEEAAKAGVAGRTRWINIFDGPGVFCVIYTIALPVALQYLGPPYSWTKRIWGGVLVAAILLATYYTGSRGGFLATVGIFGLYLLVRLRISLARMLMAGAAMLAVLMVAPSHLTSTRDSNNSAQHRIDMWAEGIEMVQSHPLVGIGKGNFANYTGFLIAHNSGIEVMGETGLVGLVLWIGVLYTSFRTIFLARAATDDPAMRNLLMALSLGVAGYLLSSLFVTLEYETLYLMLAIAGACRWALPGPVPFNRHDAMVVGAIATVFFVVIKASVMAY